MYFSGNLVLKEYKQVMNSVSIKHWFIFLATSSISLSFCVRGSISRHWINKSHGSKQISTYISSSPNCILLTWENNTVETFSSQSFISLQKRYIKRCVRETCSNCFHQIQFSTSFTSNKQKWLGFLLPNFMT